MRDVDTERPRTRFGACRAISGGTATAALSIVRGKLDVFPVCDLLRFGLRDDCSGVLELRGALGRGRIAFAHGWILEAASPATEGYPSNRNSTYAALQDLMSWTDGRFEIEVSSSDPIRQIALEVELARLLREALVDHEPEPAVASVAA